MKKLFTLKNAGILLMALCFMMIMATGRPGAAYAAGNAAPAGEDGVPADAETAPADMEAAPADAETAPADVEAAPEGEDDPAGEDYVPDNGIPVVYLEIDESRGTIAAMNADINHNTKCYGTVRIDVPEGFHFSDFPDLDCESLSTMEMDIRGRGNSTWEAEKKPYKIKLDKKTSVFGLGKNKHWVLIANNYDNTLIRDRITAWLGDEVGFEFTPRGFPVDLVMKGDQFGSRYLGSYYLSENVRVDDNRLEIDELDESVTTEPEITGGYLLQNSLQTRYGSPDIFTTRNGAGWATHTPTFDVEADDDAYENPAQQQYIQNFIQRIDDALYSDDYKDAGGTDYLDLMDIESAARYWLVNQISMNGDAYQTGSTYIYKVRDENGQIGKLYWGPLWDFDNAWDYMPMTTGFTTDFVWEKALLYDRREGGFVEEVKKQWPAFMAALDEMRADGGLIDQYYEETRKSAEADRVVNPPRDTGEGETPPSYEENIRHLKDWIMYRSIWIDYHINDLDTLMHKVRFAVDDEIYKMIYVRDEAGFPSMEEYPKKEGYVFLGWYDENDQKYDPALSEEMVITEDITYTAKYITNEEATHGQDIVFQKQNDIVDFALSADYYSIFYTVIPRDAQDKTVRWTSSDESIATIDEYGKAHLYQTGTVTFTGTLYSGVSRDFTLTITEDSLPLPESIRPEREVIVLAPGEQAGVTLITDPDPAILISYEYETDDFDVAVVNTSGIITARGEGETKIRVIAEAHDENWEDFTYETELTVIVKEKKETPVYTAASGDKAEWTKGSGDDVTITVKRSIDDESCFDHFTEVLVDGRALTKDRDYTAVKGSTVVTVPADTLESLDAGDHTVTVAFDDGEADVTLTILEAEESGEGSEETSGDDEKGDSVKPSGDDSVKPSGDDSAKPSGKDSAKPGKKSVRTGDMSRPDLWILTAAASMAGLAAVMFLKKKRRSGR